MGPGTNVLVLPPLFPATPFQTGCSGGRKRSSASLQAHPTSSQARKYISVQSSTQPPGPGLLCPLPVGGRAFRPPDLMLRKWHFWRSCPTRMLAGRGLRVAAIPKSPENLGTLLVVQRLKLCASNARGTSSVPGGGSRSTCHTAWPEINKQTNQKFPCHPPISAQTSSVSISSSCSHAGCPVGEIVAQMLSVELSAMTEILSICAVQRGSHQPQTWLLGT